MPTSVTDSRSRSPRVSATTCWNPVDVVGNPRHEAASRSAGKEPCRLGQNVPEQLAAQVADQPLADIGHQVDRAVARKSLEDRKSDDGRHHPAHPGAVRQHLVKDRLEQIGKCPGSRGVDDHRDRRRRETRAVRIAIPTESKDRAHDSYPPGWCLMPAPGRFHNNIELLVAGRPPQPRPCARARRQQHSRVSPSSRLHVVWHTGPGDALHRRDDPHAPRTLVRCRGCTPLTRPPTRAPTRPGRVPRQDRTHVHSHASTSHPPSGSRRHRSPARGHRSSPQACAVSDVPQDGGLHRPLRLGRHPPRLK